MWGARNKLARVKRGVLSLTGGFLMHISSACRGMGVEAFCSPSYAPHFPTFQPGPAPRAPCHVVRDEQGLPNARRTVPFENWHAQE